MLINLLLVFSGSIIPTTVDSTFDNNIIDCYTTDKDRTSINAVSERENDAIRFIALAPVGLPGWYGLDDVVDDAWS